MPSEKEIEEALKKRQEAIDAAKTTFEVIAVLDNQSMSPLRGVPLGYEQYFKPALLKAIDLARDSSDARSLFFDESIEEDEEFAAFKKLLSFCKCKEDVEEAMEHITDCGGSLERERYYVEIFKRGHELPHRRSRKKKKE